MPPSLESFRSYKGKDSFLLFCHKKVNFTFIETCKIERKEFGVTYRTFCTDLKICMASIVDFVAHLLYVGIKAHPMEDGDYNHYFYSGISWKVNHENAHDTPTVHESNSRVLPVLRMYPKVYPGKETFIFFCETCLLFSNNSEYHLSQFELQDAYKEFCSKKMLLEADPLDFIEHLESVGQKYNDHSGYKGIYLMTNKQRKSHHDSHTVDISCQQLEVDNKKSADTDNNCQVRYDINKRNVHLFPRVKLIDCMKQPRSKVMNNVGNQFSAPKNCSSAYMSRSVKANEGLLCTNVKTHGCVEKSQCSRVINKKTNLCKEQRTPSLKYSVIDYVSDKNVNVKNFEITKNQKWVSGVLLRDIRKYPEYIDKLCAVDGIKWTLTLPSYNYRRTESLRNFMRKNIAFTGKLTDLILYDDFFSEYSLFCSEHRLIKASKVDIATNMNLMGVNPQVRVLQPGIPRYAYSGLTWKCKALYSKYKKVQVKVILYDFQRKNNDI